MDKVLNLLVHFFASVSRFSKVLAHLGIGRYDEWKPGKKLKILLVGYNGARNTGSDVRVITIAKQIKELFGANKVELTVMTLDKNSLKGYFDNDVKLLLYSSFFPWAAYRACCEHHAAILCEGSTLKSTFANALSLLMCETAGIMKSQNKPCIAYGSEIGKTEPLLKKTAAKLCKKTYFITRTKGSLVALKKMGLNGHCGTDAAWLYNNAISNEEAEKKLCEQGWDAQKPLLGIAVIDPFCWPVRASFVKWAKSGFKNDLPAQYDKCYFFSTSPERTEAYNRYINEISRGINSFVKENDCFPVIIGMEKLDKNACLHLRRKISGQSALFLSGDNTADVMTGVLHKLSVLITSRYHAAVLAMQNGCPAVAVSIDERLDGIMKDFELDKNYLFHAGGKHLGIKIYNALSGLQKEDMEIRENIALKADVHKRAQNVMGIFMKKYFVNCLNAGKKVKRG